MGAAVTNKVLTGIYAGFSKVEMLEEWRRYKAAVKTSASRLSGAAVNGQSFQFGPRGDLPLTEWGRSIRAALAQVDPDFIAPSSQLETRFA